MPNMDGTGPFGKGPLTGRGRGKCVTKNSETKKTEKKALKKVSKN